MKQAAKSVHFPLAMGAGDGSLHRQDGKPSERRMPSILVVGSLGRDHVVIGEQLRTLHHEEASYHGKLQVILSAIRRM